MKKNRQSRVSKEDRRELILKAARDFFARTGLEGSRTSLLARAAGVSERLLYKHFPSKEALHEAALKSLADEIIGDSRRIFSLEPSTSTLVILTHYLVHAFLSESRERDSYLRASLRSMAGDARFIRFTRQQALTPFHAKLQKCVEAAISTGDIPKFAAPARIASYLIEALGAGVGPWLLPDPPIVDFGMDRQHLIEEIVRFALRGLGLSETVIERNYNPKALALLGG